MCMAACTIQDFLLYGRDAASSFRPISNRCPLSVRKCWGETLKKGDCIVIWPRRTDQHDTGNTTFPILSGDGLVVNLVTHFSLRAIFCRCLFFSSHPRLGGWCRHPRLSFPSVSPLQPDPLTSPLGFLLQDMELFLPHPRLDNFPPVSPLRSNPPHPRFNFLVLVPVRNWHFWCHVDRWIKMPHIIIVIVSIATAGVPICPEGLWWPKLPRVIVVQWHAGKTYAICMFLPGKWAQTALKWRSNDAQTTLATSL